MYYVHPKAGQCIIQLSVNPTIATCWNQLAKPTKTCLIASVHDIYIYIYKLLLIVGMEFNQVNIIYHRATNFWGYKILWIFQNLKNILEIVVRSYSSTAYYLLIFKNLVTHNIFWQSLWNFIFSKINCSMVCNNLDISKARNSVYSSKVNWNFSLEIHSNILS